MRTYFHYFLVFFLIFAPFRVPAEALGQTRTETPLRIGLEFREADDNTSFHILNENLKHLEKLANVEFIRADQNDSGTSSEQSIYNIEYLWMASSLLQQQIRFFLPYVECVKRQKFTGAFILEVLQIRRLRNSASLLLITLEIPMKTKKNGLISLPSLF